MPAGVYTIEPSHASVTWKVNHLGLSNYTARFTGINAAITLDPAKPENSSVTATIDPMSIRTDYPDAAKKDFDKELATSEQWFNAGKFPEIKFVSNKIEITGEKTGKIHGDLTLLGVTKPVVLDTVFNGAYAKQPFADLPGIGFSAKTTIKRSDWGLSTYVPNIGDDVEVWIEAEFHKK